MRCSVLLILLLGCGEDICLRNSDCLPGQSCGIDGLCAAAAVDGGSDGGVEVDADPVTPDAQAFRCVETGARVQCAEQSETDKATTGGP